MKDNLPPIIISAAVVLVVSVIMGGILYGCQKADHQYYDLANKCLGSGGTWIPNTGQNSYSGICIGARQ